MSTALKFSSKLDEKLYKSIKELSKESGQDITTLLNEAITDLLHKKSVKPAFKSAMDEAFTQYDEALSELAK